MSRFNFSFLFLFFILFHGTVNASEKFGTRNFESKITDSRELKPGVIRIEDGTYFKLGERYNTREGRQHYLKRLINSETYKIFYRNEEALRRLHASIPTSGEHFEIKSGTPETGESTLSSTLDGRGQLNFTIRTVSADGLKRGPISGKTLFDEMMSFHGDLVEEIVGNWVYETNLSMFYDAVSTSLKEKENRDGRPTTESEVEEIHKIAAAQTWTGQQAFRWGYRTVEIITVEFNEVSVIFRK